jgi:hypothetical protein
MATTDRQNRLLVAEDWRKIYQSFQQADFKSYDFETLRRTMVAYLRENYPDDFNDFVESSEYVALIDLIAYVAQALSFRVDLNARENFLETAERRNSILRLARLINYNAKRNKPATGLLKIDSISTTQDINDSSGTNISRQTIIWNDSANSNYREQFTAILNAANQTGQLFGKPREKNKISGVDTEVYTLASNQNGLPMFQFTKSVGGISRSFEIVPSTINESQSVYENDPIEGSGLTYLYRNDGSGDSSNNTGFFLLFKQGTMQSTDFVVDSAITNYVKSVDVSNINDTDVWLYKLDQFGQLSEKWTEVSSLSGNNAIYNSLSKNVRNIYNVVTKNNDAIDLVFGDGNFSNLPLGSFKTYYRISDNDKYALQSADMQNIQAEVPYVDSNGSQQTLTISMSLKASVYNSAAAESNESIKEKAGQVYYSQNRMITAEDYQVVPLSASQEIVKVRSVNRSASGISRAKEILDPTGAYSNVSVFAEDGILYKEESSPTFTFSFKNRNEIQSALDVSVESKLKEAYSRQFYYEKHGTKSLTSLSATWNSTTTTTNTNTGYFTSGGALAVGTSATSNLKYATQGALIKFTSPDTREFLNGKLITAGTENAEDRAWAKISGVVDDGSNNGLGNLSSGVGPITMNDIVPDGAVLDAVIPAFTTSFSATLENDMINRIEAYENFGLRYEEESGEWRVITTSNLSTSNNFNLGNTGNTTGANLDASWWFKFTNDGNTYTVTYRKLDYIFESVSQNKFHYDSEERIYDYTTGKVVKDFVKILRTNSLMSTGNSIGYPLQWQVTDTVTEADGFQDNRKIKIGFLDSDDDGVVDNPELFDIFIEPTVSVATKFVFFEKYISYDSIERFKPFAASNFIITEKEADINVDTTTYTDGQLFYFYHVDEDSIKIYSEATGVLSTNTDYIARKGRSSIDFQYKHHAGQETRIDPSVSNIVDVYLLERTYDNLFRLWLQDGGTRPAPSTSDQLKINYSGVLNPLKSLSDQIIYHPVKYKILFGSNADEQLQATFKVVKNTKTNVTDALIKTRVIAAMNEFFALDNWDFGDTFYFTELAAYIHNQLAPDLLTVVIVPNESGQGFGSLFQLNSAADEIYISGATVDNVSIITALGANQLEASGSVVTSTSTATINTTTGSAVSGSTTTGSGSSTGSSGTGY